MRQLSAISIAAVALAIAGQAAAQPAASSRTMTVEGGAPQVCAVQEPAITQGALLNIRGINGTTLQIDQLTDPQTLATRAARADITFEAVCNYPHRIVLESQNNGLWRNAQGAAGPPNGFADGVPYTATLEWGDVNRRFEVDASSRRTSEMSVLVDGATQGQILIHFEIQPGASNLRSNAPLIAGVYQDTLRITVEPQ